MKKWLFAWVVIVGLFFTVMLRALSFGGPIETFFSWLYVCAFAVVMAFILREILDKSWNPIAILIGCIMFVLTLVAIDKIIPNVVLPEPTNLSCAPHQKQVFGYCD